MIQAQQPIRLSTLFSRGWRPVESPRRPVLFVNPWSGDGAASRHRVVELARDRGIEAVTLGTDDDLKARVLEAVTDGADALGMAAATGPSVPLQQSPPHADCPLCVSPSGRAITLRWTSVWTGRTCPGLWTPSQTEWSP